MVHSINAIGTDAFSWGAVLNSSEAVNDGTVTVATTDIEDGQQLTITLNEFTYTGNVSSNSATVTIPAADLQALTDGQSYTLTADVSNATGVAATQVTSSSFAVDKTAPTFEASSSINVTSNNSNSAYVKQGDTITFTALFSEAVSISSSTAADMRIPFLIETTTYYADASNASSSQVDGIDTMTFTYAVPSSVNGEVSFAQSATLDFQNSATLKDTAGNDMTATTLPSLSGSITVDTTAPTFEASSSINVSSNNTNSAYAKQGDTITFTALFSEPVSISSSTAADMRIPFLIETTTYYAEATAISSSVVNNDDTMTFTYAVPSSVNGAVSFAQSATLDFQNSATLKDTAGNDMTATTLPSLSGSITVDTTAPTFEASSTIIVSSNNTNSAYTKQGDTITFTALFSEAVSISSSNAADMRIPFQIGTNAYYADASNASSSQVDGIDTMTFTYVVPASVNGAVYLASSAALDFLNSATLNDIAGNAMTATILPNFPKVYSTSRAFAALKGDGTVRAWGDPNWGGREEDLGGDVKVIYSTSGAFAALKGDGTVRAWGDTGKGGTVPSDLGGDVQAIYSNPFAFAALKGDGTVRVWGADYGGIDVPEGLSNVQAIYSTDRAFAALKQDGSVVAWGGSDYGGAVPEDLSNVQAIYSTERAFAALKGDGSVAAWGRSDYGGSGVPEDLSTVQAIYSTERAFVALKQDGSVVAWGYYMGNNGGSGVPEDLSNVQAIYSTNNAFAALKGDGSVAAWGYGPHGGTVPSDLGDNVKAIYSTDFAFAALKGDGTVRVWGDERYGGAVPSDLGDDVKVIYSTSTAFAALKGDGTVRAWGDADRGGTVPAGLVLSDVKVIYSNKYAFAALKKDGTVRVWGDANYGGSGAPTESLLYTIVNDSGSGAISTQSCFLEHTLVRTDQGYIQISKLDPCLHTIRNMKIKALIKSTLLQNHMVLIKKDSLYKHVPCVNTHMTCRHRLYYNKQYVSGDDLVNMQLASYESIPRNTHVYNVLLHSHDNMLINNMIVETQNPRAVIGKLYNNFLLNKQSNKKTISHALNYVEIMSKENWNNMKLIENGACPKSMFIDYLVKEKKENKKQVQSIMKKLM